MNEALAAVLAAVLGAPAGWYGARFAARVLAEREADEEEIPPQPGWVPAVTGVVTAAVFGAVPVFVDGDWVLPAYLWFAGLTMVLVVTDIQARLIPDRINYPGTTVAAALLLVGGILDGGGDGIFRAAIGAGVYFVVTLALFVAGGGRSFGGGDVKLSAVLGLFCAYVGWDVLVAAIVLGFLIGGLAGVALLVFRLRKMRDHFAFGPPMVLGAYIAIAYGIELVDWYLR
jgi:leader peptidase (prepilin peptidase)/N-methyltransferase